MSLQAYKDRRTDGTTDGQGETITPANFSFGV